MVEDPSVDLGKGCLQDILEPRLVPRMVPRHRYDRRSLRLQRSAFTRLAYEAELVRAGRIKLPPERWRRSTLSLRHARKWWVRDGFEPPNPEGTAFTAQVL